MELSVFTGHTAKFNQSYKMATDNGFFLFVWHSVALLSQCIKSEHFFFVKYLILEIINSWKLKYISQLWWFQKLCTANSTNIQCIDLPWFKKGKLMFQQANIFPNPIVILHILDNQLNNCPAHWHKLPLQILCSAKILMANFYYVFECWLVIIMRKGKASNPTASIVFSNELTFR